ncbi:PD-(D/E)XK nuclease family protein [Treponema sp. R6D11]
MEKTLEKNICQLLNKVAGVRKRYEAKWRRTGEKYNLFKVAKIDKDEVKICSVLADLLDPQGKHWQGNRYLGFFIHKSIYRSFP